MKKQRPKTDQNEPQLSPKPQLQACALLIGAIILVYCSSLSGEFTNWDDGVLVRDNLTIRSLEPGNIAQIFAPVPGATYQPVRVLSYAIDFAIWDYSPFGYHLVNTCLHALATIFLFLFLPHLLTLISGRSDAQNFRIAFIVALVFAIHPVNVESVAWISSRKYGLLGAFSFLALYAFARLLQQPKQDLWLAITCGFSLALALLSSPFAIVVPPLMILIDLVRTPQPRLLPMLRRSQSAYIAIAAPSLLILPLVFTGLLGGGDDAIVTVHHQGNAFYTALTMLRVLFDYAVNLAFPFWLNCKYPNTLVMSLAAPKVWAGLAMLIGLGVFAWKQLRAGNRMPAFCIAWFFIALAPVSNAIPISTTMADRYLYLPAIGVFLGVVLSLRAKLLHPNKVVIGTLSVVGLTLVVLAHCQTRIWQNSLSLWRSSLAVNEANPVAHSNLGEVLQRRGDIDAAVTHFQRSLEIYELHAPAHKNLGSIYIKRAQYEDAERHLKRALELDPRFPSAWNNLGACQMATSRFPEASVSFSQAVKQQPRSRLYSLNLAMALLKLDQLDAARLSFDTACSLSDAEGCAQIGILIANEGKFELAIHYLQRAVDQSVQSIDSYRKLAKCLYEAKRTKEAIAVLEQAIRLAPTDAGLKRILASIQAQP